MIKVFNPKLTLFDKYSVIKALLNNEISGSSNKVIEFEQKLAKSFNRKYSVVCSNGSVALDVSFQLLDLKEGDEVILPSFTIISCLSAILRAGATPVFCDVDPETWNMKIENVKDVYTSKTKAVLIVHTYGLTADVKEINKFCKEKKLKIVEDSAEAHGQSFGNIQCGSVGDISTLSFYANKHVTTGEGGAILTDNFAIYKKAKQMINLDFKSDKRFFHENLYWNYRLGGLQSALGSSQLDNINKVILSKIKQGKRYTYLFNKYNIDVQLPVTSTIHSFNHFWVYGIIFKDNINRDNVAKKLKEAGIETRPFFYPLHLQPSAKIFKQKNKKLINSERLGKQGLYLPLGKHVKPWHQKKIVLQVKKLIQGI
tara:strand:- start:963 stop:2072 length:1110 start_codon:yes stop_codon:yes gene_type:complete